MITYIILCVLALTSYVTVKDKRCQTKLALTSYVTVKDKITKLKYLDNAR
jgi:ubiquitin